MPRQSSPTLDQLGRLLEERRRSLMMIPARMQHIGEAVDAIDKELRSMEHGKRKPKRGAAGKRVRPAAGADLVSMLLKVLSGASEPMGIAALAEAVRKEGYKSTSPAFMKIVGMTLSSNKKRFKRAGRGLYAAAG